MRGDIPQVAMKLMTYLPVRVHFQPEPLTPGKRRYAAMKKRGPHRQVQVGKRIFNSIKHASEVLNVHHKTIRKMLASGHAQFLSSGTPKSRKNTSKKESRR